MKPSVLALWIFSKAAPLQAITESEKEWAKELPKSRAEEFQHSRGYARLALSQLWRIPPLEIPLTALPRKAPLLKDGWGHISFSHCSDALLVGWSPKKIGVDIERTDRHFKAKQLVKRYFSKEEQESMMKLDANKLKAETLRKWVIKEAAIKWQGGQISSDLPEWINQKDTKLVQHKTLGYTVGIDQINFQFWHIAIAYDQYLHKNSNKIICI